MARELSRPIATLLTSQEAGFTLAFQSGADQLVSLAVHADLAKRLLELVLKEQR